MQAAPLCVGGDELVSEACDWGDAALFLSFAHWGAGRLIKKREKSPERYCIPGFVCCS